MAGECDEDSFVGKILKQFIECNLHPHEGKRADWEKSTVCVCLITKTEPTDGDDPILIVRNEKHGLHAEEILLKRIKENGHPGDAKIKLFLSYSPCNDEGHECSTKLGDLHGLFKQGDISPWFKQVTVRFSGFYNIKRPSCISYGKCCKTTNADSFRKLFELGASPIEEKDWDELIGILTEYDRQMQRKDETQTLTALNTIRNGEEYGDWRDWEDKRMMEDYNEMAQKCDEDSYVRMILKQFIVCNLHPYGNRFANCTDIHAVCVCLITKTKPTDGDDTISLGSSLGSYMIKGKNEPGGLHVEEILLERIKEKGYPNDANIKVFINYSPCNDEGHKCSTKLKELKQVTVRFSGFYDINRPSCISYGKCNCKTINADSSGDSFRKLLKLGASPIEKKDWDQLIRILTAFDMQMQGKDEAHTFSALNTIRNGEWYGEWRDWEDKRMMEDYNKMRDDELQSGIPRRRDVPPPGQPPRQPPLQEKGETAADMLAGNLDSLHLGN